MLSLTLQIVAALAPLTFQNPPDAETQAWDAAVALKTRAEYVKAAGAFEAWHDTFPESARAANALVEAGVCWFTAGRSAQTLHRSTPETKTDFAKAMKLFERVTAEFPKGAAASRAQYMKGSTLAFDGDLAGAETAYTTVVDAFAVDSAYVGKAIERRSFVRRHLFKTADAIADLELYLKSYAKPDVAESARTNLTIARSLDKPAFAWTPEAWVQGDPVSLDSLAGQVVALYFFASWCPHCAEELPFVLDLEHRYAPVGLKFVGVVNHSQKQTVESVRKYLNDKAIPFCVLMDGGATNTAYASSTIPHLVLIDRLGKIRWRDNPSNLSDWTIETILKDAGDKKADGPPPPPKK